MIKHLSGFSCFIRLNPDHVIIRSFYTILSGCGCRRVGLHVYYRVNVLEMVQYEKVTFLLSEKSLYSSYLMQLYIYIYIELVLKEKVDAFEKANFLQLFIRRSTEIH